MRSLFWVVVGVAVLGPRPAAAQGVRELGAATAPVTALAFSPSGELLATAGADRVVRVWRPDGGALQWATAELPAAVTALAFRPDGRALAVGDDAGGVEVWGPGAEKPRSVGTHKGGVCALVFGPDGATLFSGGQDRTVKVWDATAAGARRSISPLPEVPSALAVSRDGTRLAVADAHGVALYQAEQCKYERTWPCADGAVSAVAFSPDGRTLIAACGEGTVRLWSVAGYGAADCLHGHGSPVRQLSFDATGRRLCSVGQNGQTVIWDTANGTALFSHRFPAPTYCGAISPTGECVAVGTLRPACYLLDLPRNVR